MAHGSAYRLGRAGALRGWKQFGVFSQQLKPP